MPSCTRNTVSLCKENTKTFSICYFHATELRTVQGCDILTLSHVITRARRSLHSQGVCINRCTFQPGVNLLLRARVHYVVAPPFLCGAAKFAKNIPFVLVGFKILYYLSWHCSMNLSKLWFWLIKTDRKNSFAARTGECMDMEPWRTRLKAHDLLPWTTSVSSLAFWPISSIGTWFLWCSSHRLVHESAAI